MKRILLLGFAATLGLAACNEGRDQPRRELPARTDVGTGGSGSPGTSARIGNSNIGSQISTQESLTNGKGNGIGAAGNTGVKKNDSGCVYGRLSDGHCVPAPIGGSGSAGSPPTHVP